MQDMDKSGFGKLRRAEVADNLLDLTVGHSCLIDLDVRLVPAMHRAAADLQDSAPHTRELIKGMHLDTEGTMSRTQFAKLYTMYHRRVPLLRLRSRLNSCLHDDLQAWCSRVAAVCQRVQQHHLAAGPGMISDMHLSCARHTARAQF